MWGLENDLQELFSPTTMWVLGIGLSCSKLAFCVYFSLGFPLKELSFKCECYESYQVEGR